jgi:hypothetical protein
VALIELKIEPDLILRGVKALESIADTLRMYCFPIKLQVPSQPAPPENLTVYDAEAEWEREQREEAAREQANQQPFL